MVSFAFPAFLAVSFGGSQRSTGTSFAPRTTTDWAEDSDIPCWFRVRSRHLNTASVQTNEASLGGTSCEETNSSQETVQVQQANRYISGIAVCRNNQRIKGVEVSFSAVSPTGTRSSRSGQRLLLTGYNAANRSLADDVIDTLARWIHDRR
jgi:hypothetical protein